MVAPSSAPARRVVVVGGGWAGYTAAEALSADPTVEVTLLEASPRAAGGLAGGWRTPGGRPVEAGIHGFWREYQNTFKVIDQLGLDRDEILTPFTPSVLVSKNGKVATAPVLADGATGKSGDSAGAAALTPDKFIELLQYSPIAAATTLASANPSKAIADLLPAPLDTALLAEFSDTSPLTVLDRASAIGLLACWADFAQEDPESWRRYDDVSAEDLFKKYGGVSDTLYDELVAPLLHVLPMGPGYDISAAAALSCFHVFALQSRGAFDVRWCRGGISEKIFSPWQARLEARGNVRLEGGARVSTISSLNAEEEGGGLLSVEVLGRDQPFEADAVVLAVGATSAARLVQQSPMLEGLPATRRFAELRGVTCVAVRLYLQPSAAGRTGGLQGGAHDSTLLPREVAEAMRATPVTVVGPEMAKGRSELLEAGYCVYDLQRMHDEHAAGELAVLEVDFYRADAIAEMEDDADVTALALEAARSALGVDDSVLSPSMVVDVAVVRARRAVSHFALGSAALSPGVRLGGGVYACGDWIDRTGHASWSTEKSVVTARQAAAAIGSDLGLASVDGDVIPAAPDTPQLAALRQVAATLRRVAPPDTPTGMPPPAPWAALRSLLQQR
jgi:uncharacterized protein with NAD-binding domain and iron-sulfur cluster